jgi:hypothetical protein
VFRPRCLCFPLNSAVCWPLLCSWGRRSYDSTCKSHANTDGTRRKSVNAPLSGTGPPSGRAKFELRYGISSGAGARCGLSLDTTPQSKTKWVICRSPPHRGRPQSGRIWFELPHAISSGAGARCGLSFDTPPYRGAGPRRYGLSFDTPPIPPPPIKNDMV